jgi:hypothetical protein
MKEYVLRCTNRPFCPRSCDEVGATMRAHTRTHAQASAPECPTCGVKLAVVSVLDDPERLITVRRAG